MKDLKALSENPSEIDVIDVYNRLPEIGQYDTVDEAIRCVEAIGNVRKNTSLFNNCKKIQEEIINEEKPRRT